MRRTRILQVALVVLMAVMSVGSVAGAAGIPFERKALFDSAMVSERDPEIQGSLIAFTTSSPLVDDGNSSIYVYDLATGEHWTIGAGDGVSQLNPDVSLGRVVYEESVAGNSNIRCWDSWLDVDFPVAENADDEVNPRIDGNLIAWERPGLGELWYSDLGRGVTAQVPSASASTLADYDVDNGRVVWTYGDTTSAIRFFEPGVSGTVTEYVMNLGTGIAISSVRAHGSKIAYTRDHTDAVGSDADARALDLQGNWSLDPVPGSVFNESNPVIFHKDIAWQTDIGGDTDLLFRDYGGDVSNISSGDTDDEEPSMFGRKVVSQVVGGTFGWDVWMASATPESARTAGTDRYVTAVAVSRSYFTAAGSAVLCTGANFPDALSAAPLARVLRGPLLLTTAGSVDSRTLAELERLGVDDVYVIGGEGVISKNVMTQLTNAGMTPHRIAGSDRYGTSAQVARFMATQVKAPKTVNKAFFARGDNFPDALAVSPVAAGALSPIMLVQTAKVPDVIADTVDDLNLTSGVIAGGPDVVSNGVRDSLRRLMVANGGDDHDPMIVERWYGATRYDTAVAIVDNGLEARYIDLDTLGIATGLNFPDALGGGAMLGWYGSPLLLTQPTIVPASVSAFLSEQEYQVGRLDIFGGSDVVSDSVRRAIAAKLK